MRHTDMTSMDAYIRWSFFLFGGALLVRVANLLLFPDEGSLFLVPDSSIYLELRDNLASTGEFVRSDGAGGYAYEIERVPGYPLFLNYFAAIFGNSVKAIIWGQSVLDSLTVVLLALLGGQISFRTFLITGILAMLWPNLIITSTQVLNDTLFNLTFSATLLAFAVFLKRPSFAAAIAGGSLFGVSLMVRPVFQFLPLVLILIAFVSSYVFHGCKAVRSGALALIMAVFMIVPIASHLHRNVSEFDTVSLTSQAGTHLLGWVLPLVKWHAEGIPYDAAFLEGRSGYYSYLKEEGIEPESLSSFAASQHKSNFVVEELRGMRTSVLIEAWFKGAVINVGVPALSADPRFRAARGESLVDGLENLSWSARLFAWVEALPAPILVLLLIGTAGSFLLTMVQLIGGLSILRSMPWITVFGVMLALYILLLMGPVVGAKYRLPFVAVEIVFGALGIQYVWERICRWRL